MWKQGIAALGLLALAGCGGSEAEPEATETVVMTETPTETEGAALTDACERIFAMAPDKVPGKGWIAVLDEAEYLTESDDPELRDFGRDLVSVIEPVVVAWKRGMTMDEFERLTGRFANDFPALRDEWCPEV